VVVEVTRRLGVGVLALFAVCAMPLQASDPRGERQLQEAADLLESRNNLPRAAQLLEEVSRSSDRALAARALFYLAHVRERQGQRQAARATYARIVKEFSSQRDITDRAQERLAALGGAGAPSVPALRPVAGGDDADAWAHMTSDGRLMSRVDARSGDVVIRDMATGRTTRLWARPDSLQASRDHAEFAMISPDATRVAYVWLSFTERGQCAQLRVMRNEPRAPSRDLLDGCDYSYLEPIAWSKDGASILVTARSSGNLSEFVWVSVPQRTARRLRVLGDRLGPSRPRLSPDGRFIAYAAFARSPGTTPEERNAALSTGDQHVVVVAADEREHEVAVVRGANINESPLWTPDGRHLLFVSNRSADGFGLWSVAIESGRPIGEASYLGVNISGRIQPVALTAAGTLYYLREQTAGRARVDVYVADLDVGTGRVKGRPVRLLDSVVDRNLAPAWSPDGERVAFRRRPVMQAVPLQQQPLDVVIHTVATGAEETFQSVGIVPTAPLWIDATRRLLVESGGASGVRLLRTSHTTLEPRPLESFAHATVPYGWTRSTLATDGRLLYLVALTEAAAASRRAPVEYRIVAFDLTMGDQRDVATLAGATAVSSMTISPDHRSLAVVLQRPPARGARIVIVDAATGHQRELVTSMTPREIRWTRAGLFASVEGAERTAVVRVSSDGGVATPTGITVPRDQTFDVTMDGTRIVFSDRTQPDEDQLWSYDSLLARLAATR
jgi:Tol biopolymer transport system component